MDRLKCMQVFVRAVDLGSFTAAAEALEMSAQGVGKHVQALERHLGVQLLHRTTRRQSLTDFGREYVELARTILADLEQADQLAAQTRAVPSGRLRVSAPVNFGVHTLAPKLPEYMRAHPDVRVDLHLSNHLVDVVDEGYDVVFRVGALPDSGLVARELAPYSLTVCAAPSYLAGHPALHHPSELTRHDCLGLAPSEPRTCWSFVGPDGSVDVPVRLRHVWNHGDALIHAAAAGLGVVHLAMDVVRPALDDGRLVRVLPDWQVPSRPLHLVYAPDRRVTPKLRSFIEFAVGCFGGGLAKSESYLSVQRL